MNIKKLEPVDNISKTIKDIFDVDLSISGGWGYDSSSATIIENLQDTQAEQFLHMFASMRANIQLNITLDKDEKYGGINLTFIEKKRVKIDDKTYCVVTFKITAMKEKLYAKFIQEYKDGYGKKEFDLADHFNQRKQSTIEDKVDYWFDDLKGVLDEK